MSIAYLDSSALVKLVVRERETDALHRALEEWPERTTSAVARVEVPRALRERRGPADVARARALVGSLACVDLGTEVTERAVLEVPTGLRSLDAIHLASALSLGDELGVFVAYDRRLAEAAEALGVPVLAPA